MESSMTSIEAHLRRTREDYETAVAAATVLGFRLPMLWAMTFDPTPERRAEALRMVTEKSAAVAEGFAAAWTEAALAGLQMATGVNPAGRIAAAALRPARRKVKANARRLKRRKRL
jgi:hypothetical protein